MKAKIDTRFKSLATLSPKSPPVAARAKAQEPPPLQPRVGLTSRRAQVVVSKIGEEPAPRASDEGYKRLHPALRPLARAFDYFEALFLQWIFGRPGLRAKLEEAHGYGVEAVPKLYRGITAEEARALKRRGWRYDATDPRNRGVKFAVPSLAIAKKFAPPGGAVVELEAKRAVRWYEISRRWSRGTFFQEVQEHVVPLDAIEKVRLAEPTIIRAAADTIDLHRIHRTVHAGESVDIDLGVERRGVPIEQVDLIWNAEYSVPDPARGPTPEGKPFYKDGVFASTFVVDGRGKERRLDNANFVDVEEEDNLHDLGFPGYRPAGDKLRVKFFAKEPEGDGHEVQLRGARVRYRASERAPQVKLPVGAIIPAGGRVSLALPEALRDRRMVRVEARWTDMLSGTWTRTGRAIGTLLLDGQRTGKPETVQSPETQSFNARGLTARAVGVLIEDDPARVDWIKVYFED